MNGAHAATERHVKAQMDPPDFLLRSGFPIPKVLRVAIPPARQLAPLEADAVEQREEAFLVKALAGRRLLRLRAPFPADPRPIAAMLEEIQR